jgi:hypothetical protein
MKAIKLFFILTLLGFNVSCRKGEIIDSSDPNLKKNSNVTFFIEYNIDGEKFRYQVDTVDMYLKNDYPSGLIHYTADDNLYFGSYTVNPYLSQGYVDLQAVMIPNMALINPFGQNKATYPKLGFFCKVPFFSNLKLNTPILNDTITKNNSLYSAEKMVAHLTKHSRPFVFLDSNTYQMYEAGVMYSSTSDKTALKKLKPSNSVLSFKITDRKNISYKWQNLTYNVTQLDGEFKGKMRKYWSFSGNIIYSNYVDVKITFSLPMSVM